MSGKYIAQLAAWYEYEGFSYDVIVSRQSLTKPLLRSFGEPCGRYEFQPISQRGDIHRRFDWKPNRIVRCTEYFDLSRTRNAY